MVLFYAGLKPRHDNATHTDPEYDMTTTDDSIGWATKPSGMTPLCDDEHFSLKTPPKERTREVKTYRGRKHDESAIYVILQYVPSSPYAAPSPFR